MPKIIELIGPSGIGKSYILDRLKNEWNKNDSWAVYQDFRFERKKRKDYTFLEFIYDKYSKLTDRIDQIYYFNNDNKRLYNRKRFFKNNPLFISNTFDLIDECCREGYGGRDNRYYSTIYFLRTIEQIQGVLNKKYDKRACIFDEGFLNRIMHLNSMNFNDMHLKKYLEYMPLPHAVIYIKSDVETIVSNIGKRFRLATVHEGLNKEQIFNYTKETQKFMKIAVNEISKRGVIVHELNLESINNNGTKVVIDFLDSLHQ